MLDTCLDTAPFGDERAWAHPPTSAHIADGWMTGRGSADSKSGTAIFCHIAARLAAGPRDWHGTLVLLCDVDEHTGGFGGAKRYFEGDDAPTDVAGVMIGYPGMDKLVVVGGRGVHRAKLHVHGIASHSGSSKTTPSAIEKAADLVRTLTTAELPAGATAEFPLPGKLTVTAMTGGEGYSVTPDLCSLNVQSRPSVQRAAPGSGGKSGPRRRVHTIPADLPADPFACRVRCAGQRTFQLSAPTATAVETHPTTSSTRPVPAGEGKSAVEPAFARIQLCIRRVKLARQGCDCGPYLSPNVRAISHQRGCSARQAGTPTETWAVAAGRTCSTGFGLGRC